MSSITTATWVLAFFSAALVVTALLAGYLQIQILKERHRGSLIVYQIWYVDEGAFASTLIIRNVGQSVASDVVVEFIPDEQSEKKSSKRIGPLGPGNDHRLVYFSKIFTDSRDKPEVWGGRVRIGWSNRGIPKRYRVFSKNSVEREVVEIPFDRRASGVNQTGDTDTERVAIALEKIHRSITEMADAHSLKC